MRDNMASSDSFVSVGSIERCIFLLRGHRVILSGDLAVFYDVEPGACSGGKKELKSFS